MAISFNMRASVAPEVMIREVGGESVILDLKSETYSGLDAVATRMWEVLLQSETIEAAYTTLLSEYEVAPDKLRKDLGEFVEKLAAQQLLVLSEKP
jgi:hypothetical protein